MNCTHCGETVALRKSLQKGKSGQPDECPECGGDLEPQSNTRIAK